jgi:hypothetical protein
MSLPDAGAPATSTAPSFVGGEFAEVVTIGFLAERGKMHKSKQFARMPPEVSTRLRVIKIEQTPSSLG